MEDRLEEFFKNHNIQPKMSTARSYIFDCPACGGKSKLYIQKEDGETVCFKQKSDRCPFPRSKPSYALSLLSGLSLEEVRKEIYEFITTLSDEIRVSFDDEVKKKEVKELKPGTLPLDILLIEEEGAEDGLKYMHGRGFDNELLKKEMVLYSPSMRRVIFPVVIGKTLYGWQGRAVDDVPKEKRMDNMPGEWRSRTLMFYNNIVGKDFAIVAEGAASALKFKLAGNYVATMGKNISGSQLEILRESGIKKLYLALDPDAVDKLAHIRETMDNELKGRIKCYVIPVPENREDFGASTYQECLDAFNKAEPLTGDEFFGYIEFKLKGNI